jgi:hypothetical protein
VSLALVGGATLLLAASQLARFGPGSLFALTFDYDTNQFVPSIWTRAHALVQLVFGGSWAAFGVPVLLSRALSPPTGDDTDAIRPLPVMSRPATAALIAWTAFIVFVLLPRALNPGPSSILRRVGGPAAGHPFVASRYGYDSYLTLFAIWTLGAVLTLAVGYVIRQRQPSLDVIALTVWTLGFFVFAFSAPRDVYCPSPDDLDSTCYAAWWPGLARFAIWLVVSALILVVGEAVRRSGRGPGVRDAPRQPST